MANLRLVSYFLMIFSILIPGSIYARPVKMKQSPPIGGLVTEVKGDWYLKEGPRQPLKQFDIVPVGAVIEPLVPIDTSAFITVYSVYEKKEWRKNCAQSKACQIPLKIEPNLGSLRTKPIPSKSFLERILLVWDGLGKRPKRYESVISKGSDVFDAVVKIENSLMDVQPIFRAANNNLYQLTFRKIEFNEQPGSGNIVSTVSFRKKQGGGWCACGCGISPGLYHVSILPEGNEDPEVVWALICAPADYERQKATFEEFLSKTKQWEEIVGIRKESYLRSFLETLAFPENPSVETIQRPKR